MAQEHIRSEIHVSQDEARGETIAQRLREQIERGGFKAGDRLIEDVLARKFAVSRAFVHDALKLLKVEGLVQHQQNRGFCIPVLTLQDATDVYQARECLEGTVARLFAERATPTEIEQLHLAIETFSDAASAYAEQPDHQARFEALFAAKNEFYSKLLAGADNPVIANLLRSLRTRIWQFRRSTLSEPGRALQTSEELGLIYKAIYEQDAKGAERASIRHVQLAAKVAYNQLRRLHEPSVRS